jgi:hypothetical protein
MEIYKKEWGDPEDPDGTVIDAYVLADGSIRISGTDYGKSARNFSGNEEYDYGMHIQGADVPRFAQEILKRSFNLRGVLSISKVEKICKNAEIETTSWRG